MSRHYLNVPFAQKDAAKSLGARFDGAVKRWYVEDERDLPVFAQIARIGQHVTSSVELALPSTAGAIALAAGKGISLSHLLGGVANAIAHAFNNGVCWTLVEVVEARARGHVYLELSERDSSGQPIAKARRVI